MLIPHMVSFGTDFKSENMYDKSLSNIRYYFKFFDLLFRHNYNFRKVSPSLFHAVLKWQRATNSQYKIGEKPHDL